MRTRPLFVYLQECVTAHLHAQITLLVFSYLSSSSRPHLANGPPGALPTPIPLGEPPASTLELRHQRSILNQFLCQQM